MPIPLSRPPPTPTAGHLNLSATSIPIPALPPCASFPLSKHTELNLLSPSHLTQLVKPIPSHPPHFADPILPPSHPTSQAHPIKSNSSSPSYLAAILPLLSQICLADPISLPSCPTSRTQPVEPIPSSPTCRAQLIKSILSRHHLAAIELGELNLFG